MNERLDGKFNRFVYDASLFDWLFIWYLYNVRQEMGLFADKLK